MGYTEACGTTAANTNIVATGGIDKKGITGAYRGLFWAAEGFSFASVTAAKDIANWNTAVAAGNLIYLGKGKFEDQSAEATFFEDNALSIREEQTAATKVIRYTSALCACSHAEIKKMNGKEGRLFIQTSKGFAIGRLESDGTIKGRSLSQLNVGQRTVPTDDQPVEYTIVDFTFADNAGDELNPLEIKLDFLFSEVEQVFPLDGVVSGVSSNGSVLTFDIKITKDCSTEVLEGVLAADLSVVSETGAALSISGAITESPAGTYEVNVTTALTLAYVSFNGIRTKSGVMYYMGSYRVSTT